MDKVKILAIDDNADNLIVLKALLSEAFPEAQFMSAPSGKTGIELCMLENPDVVLLDIVMPEMDGYQVCQILKAGEATKTIPIIMVTAARTDKESRIKALDSGADAFLAKPVDESELTAQVRAMFRIKEAENRKLDETDRLRRLVDEKTEALQIELMERKLAEIALKNSEERFHLLFNDAPVGYQSLDFDGYFIEVNQQWLDTLGYTRDEVIGKWFGDFLSPEYQDGFREQFQLFKSIGRSHSEFEMVHKNGKKLFIAFEGRIGYDSRGDFKQTHCMLQDITEKRLAEKALRDSEEKYRRMVDLLPDAIIIHAEGRIVYANMAAYKILGVSSVDQLKDQPVTNFVHPDSRSQAQARIRKIYETGEASGFAEEKFITFNNEVKIAEVIGIPIKYMGKPAVQTILRDITDRKTSEEALKSAYSLTEVTLESIHNGILVVNKQGKVIKTSQRFAEMWNIPEDILAAGDDKKLIDSILVQLADPDGFIKKVSELYQNPDAESSDLIYFNDGRVFERISKPMLIDGQPDGRVWSFLDISERMKTLESLRSSEEQSRQLFQKAADAIFIADIETGIIVDANEAASRLMLMPHSKIIGMHQSKLHPDVHPALTKNAFKFHKEKVQQKEQTRPIEDEIVRSDGTKVPVEVLAGEVFIKGKHCLMGTFRDITQRKLAEDLLRESEYFFKESQRAAFVGSYKFDIVGDFWTSTEVLDQIFGIDKTFDRSLQGWQEIIHPEDREMMTRYFGEEVIGKRQPFNKEYRIVSQTEGEIRWVLGLGKLSFDSEGNIREMIGTIQDITERKLAEQARNESYEFNQSLLKTIPFGMNIVDEKGNLIFQSENLKNTFGKQAIGRKCWELYRDDHTQCRDCPLLQGIDLGKTATCETINVFGGRIFEISHTGMIFKGEKALLEIFQDITERKKAEDQLKESQQLFAGLFDASPDAIVLIDPHGEGISWPIVDCNEAACRMNGYIREEMIGKSIDLLNLTEGTREERQKYLANLRIHPVLQKESFHMHKDGYIFPVEISTSIVIIGGKEMVLGIDRDITERKLAEDAIRVSEVRLKRAELASKSGNWEYYLDSQTMIGSEGAQKIYGLAGEQFEFEMVKNIPLAEYRPMLNDALKNLVEHDVHYEVEFKIRTADTHEIKDIHSVAFLNREKKIVFGILQDITERKRSEAELNKSEDRYRQFISQVSEGVYRLESDQPIDILLPVEKQVDLIYDHMFVAECNQAFIRMYGIADEKEMIGKSHLDFHGGRNNPVNRGAIREFVNSGYRFENAITEEVDSIGNLRYFSNNSLGIIENNCLVRMWGTQTDITEKNRAEQMQQVLFSISNAALSSIDLSKLIEFISLQVGKLIDATNFYIAFYDEKTDMLSTVYERDEKDVIETWSAKNSITGYVIKHQKSLLLKEDQVVEFYLSSGIETFGTPSKVWLGVPLVSNKKAIGAIVVQSYDNPNAYSEKDQQMLEFISYQISISIERKKTEQDLKLLGKAFDQSPVTIVITDKNGSIEYVNPKFTESTGYSFEEVKGHNPRILQSGHQSKEYYRDLWETILAGKDWFGEFHNKRKNGESFWESAVISPITNENGEIGFFMAIKEDISEKKMMIDDLVRAKEKAQESDRLKSSFLANMSHEIRTPLNSIIGFSELLLDPDFNTEQHEEFAKTINASGNGLLTIISDIMDLSKIEAGQIQVIRKRFSVNKMISAIQKEYSYRASEKGIELRSDPANPQEEIFLISDEQRLRQVLINFVGNAIKFTEEGFIEIGFVSLRLAQSNVGSMGELVEPGSVGESFGLRFFVKDTGIGIPEQYHQQIFERFRQVEVAHTRKYGGNGLGLAISKSLIEMMGGEIGLESEPGKGSTFYFTIPV